MAVLEGPVWARDVSTASKQAIAHFHLRELGWKGFDKLDWAEKLLRKHQSIGLILLSCNIGNDESFEALRELADEMSDEDRHHLRDYIIGKLGLEELSCQAHGPGSGNCDRRSALYRCAAISLTWE